MHHVSYMYYFGFTEHMQAKNMLSSIKINNKGQIKNYLLNLKQRFLNKTKKKTDKTWIILIYSKNVCFLYTHEQV